jgi:acetyl-CoA synthetase
MKWPTIEKRRQGWKITPNLLDYKQAVAAFSWENARRELNGLPHAPGLNIAYEAVDRHAAGHRRNHLALRWLGRHGEQHDFTYGDLYALTNQFANVLQKLDVGKGDRVFVLAGRIPELYITALGTLKNGSVFCPLFSAFGPEPIRQRLAIGDGKVLITTATLYKRKVAEIRSVLPNLEHVLLVGSAQETATISGSENFHQLMDAASPEFTIAPTDPEDLALLHFTSGTTGKPKGAMHVHNAVIAHHMTGT